LHAKISGRTNQKSHHSRGYSIEKTKQVVKSLQRSIEKSKLPRRHSAWSKYYDEVTNRDEYLANKQRIISEWLKLVGPLEKTLDAGCNTGQFSLILADYSKLVIAIDSDEKSIDTFHQHIRDSNIIRESNILPLTQDLHNMSPANGLLGKERSSFEERGPFDLVMGLALVHHLFIGRQVPIANCVSLFSKLSKRYLVLEFVSMDDPWAKMLLAAKSNKTHLYNQIQFEMGFRDEFKIIDVKPIPKTQRILYLFERL
jgi:SAM-dependent methyltransferase